MFLPIYDYNPLRTLTTPWVTRGLIVVTTLIFVVFQSGFVIDANRATLGGFGMIPAEFFEPAGLRRAAAVIPEPLTFVTYVFLHGGWMHLIGNMLFLWVFGDNVEDAMGHTRFLLFYLLCGIAAGITHAVAAPGSSASLVGASGAIAGLLAAYVILHPRVKVWCLFFGRIPLKISAMWAIGAWFVFQIVSLIADSGGDTAWWAHIGGMATGAFLIPFFRRADVQLFDRDLPIVIERTSDG